MAKENVKKPPQDREEYIKRLISGNYSTQPVHPPIVDVEPIPAQEQVSEMEADPVPVEQDKRQETPKETKRKRVSHGDYESLFLVENELKARKGTYVSDNFYKKIVKITHITGNNDKLGVSGYIDNVLRQHFETYDEDIKRLIKQGIESLM